MNEVKLKPCPFCGGQTDMATWIGGYRVICKKCGAATASASTRDAVVKAWNKRDGRQTYREYFEEQFPWDAFPDADVESIIDILIDTLCPNQLFGEMHDPPDCDGVRCPDCWDREMP